MSAKPWSYATSKGHAIELLEHALEQARAETTAAHQRVAEIERRAERMVSGRILIETTRDRAEAMARAIAHEYFPDTADGSAARDFVRDLDAALQVPEPTHTEDDILEARKLTGAA
jgi:hypothetical protein